MYLPYCTSSMYKRYISFLVLKNKYGTELMGKIPYTDAQLRYSFVGPRLSAYLNALSLPIHLEKPAKTTLKIRVGRYTPERTTETVGVHFGRTSVLPF